MQSPSSDTRQRIAIVSASVGAGHDGAARELARRLESNGFEVTRHDLIELMPAGVGQALRRGYVWQLRLAPRSWGWLLRSLERHAALARLAGFLAYALSRHRMRVAVGLAPAAVVSTYPLAGQVLGRLRRSGSLDAPVVTYLTDPSVHRLWVSAGVDAHCALHPIPAHQARRWGARRVTVTRPAVPPQFRPDPARVAADRLAFGLPPRRPLALVVAGSWGVGDIERTVRDITDCGVATAVVACGHNDALRVRLVSLGGCVALGWTDDMASLVRACDVVVQNAGGLSCLEALASDVPVLTYRALPGHGRTNAEALDHAGMAVWVRRQDQLATALKRAIAGEQRRPAGLYGDDPATVIAALAGASAPAIVHG